MKLLIFLMIWICKRLFSNWVDSKVCGEGSGGSGSLIVGVPISGGSGSLTEGDVIGGGSGSLSITLLVSGVSVSVPDIDTATIAPMMTAMPIPTTANFNSKWGKFLLINNETGYHTWD